MRATFWVCLLVVGMVACSAAFAAPEGDGWVQCTATYPADCSVPGEEGKAVQFKVLAREFDSCGDSLVWRDYLFNEGQFGEMYAPYCYEPAPGADDWIADSGGEVWHRVLFLSTSEPPPADGEVGQTDLLIKCGLLLGLLGFGFHGYSTGTRQ